MIKRWSRFQPSVYCTRKSIHMTRLFLPNGLHNPTKNRLSRNTALTAIIQEKFNSREVLTADFDGRYSHV